MPQLDKLTIKERAQRLRIKGQERLARFLNESVGATQRVLIETQNAGRNEQFANVRFAQSLSPGAIVKARVTAASASYLEARLAA